MNFYKRYPGDYQRDTGHLSLAEHGAYTVLLDAFYGTSLPLSPDVSLICRLVRAVTRSERKAVQSVLDQFWTLTDEGWINPRAQKEIEAVAKYSADQSERAKRRWAGDASASASASTLAEPEPMQTLSRSDASHSQTPQPRPDPSRRDPGQSEAKSLGQEERERKKSPSAHSLAHVRIFDYWNEHQALTTHRELSAKTKQSITARLSNGFDEADIIQAITRYAELCVYGRAPGHNNWTLHQMLSRDSGGYIDMLLNPDYDGIPTAEDRDPALRELRLGSR